MSFLNRLKEFFAKQRVLSTPGVRIAPSARVNFQGIRLAPNTTLEIGEGSIIEGTITTDREGAVIRIGRNTYIGNSGIVSAKEIDIGNEVLIAWGCWLVDHDSHSLLPEVRREDPKEWYHHRKNWDGISYAPVQVADIGWIGFNSIILKGVTIGRGGVVGAGSVVTKSVPPYCVFAGNPARLIKEIEINVQLL